MEVLPIFSVDSRLIVHFKAAFVINLIDAKTDGQDTLFAAKLKQKFYSHF